MFYPKEIKVPVITGFFFVKYTSLDWRVRQKKISRKINTRVYNMHLYTLPNNLESISKEQIFCRD